ncbi:MAG: HAD family hydrolase [Bacteroidota bacterium]
MPAQHILSRFPVLLLDMNRTFMLDADRFGPDEDYAATYRGRGGMLPDAQVHALITACYAYLDVRYRDPAYHDAFPTVPQVLRALPSAVGLSNGDVRLLAQTFAAHEVGQVPEAYAAGLRRLATTHRLALIADIWAEAEPWRCELRRAGVLDLFEATVFSSDLGSVKPSPRAFHRVMAQMDVPPDACVMIGDSARRDIGGARAAGVAAIWIGDGEAPDGAEVAVRDLLDLVPQRQDHTNARRQP